MRRREDRSAEGLRLDQRMNPDGAHGIQGQGAQALMYPTRARFIGVLASASAAQQDRQGRLQQGGPGHAAEHPFPEPRVAEGGGFSQEHVTRVLAAG